jgi:octaprenyl-diphosphate synthase
MSPIEEITNPILSHLELFESKLAEYLKGENPLIYEVTQHLLSSTGKRLRPATLILSAAALGHEGDEVIAPSIALELIHTATLLHDDVIDESDSRRGKETVNHRWNNLVAVLSGDYFFAKAFKILVKSNRADLLDLVSDATERVSVGELGQIQELDNTSITETMYLDIISDKTASLFSCAGKCGAMLSRANGNMSSCLYDYGESLGVAFQIADDLLDYVGDEKKLGKGIGSDLKEGWFTLPLIYSLKNSSPAVAKEIKSILENGFREEQFDKIRDFVNDSGGMHYSRQRAAFYCDQALKAIKGIEESDAKRSLTKLAEFAVSREQ